MNQNQNQPATLEQALQVADNIIFGLHKRALFGRLGQHGTEITTEKEAAAVMELGNQLVYNADGMLKESAADVSYGDGPFAKSLSAFQAITGISTSEIAPGFPKQAAAAAEVPVPELPPAIIDQAYNAAFQLAQDQDIYNAAVLKRAYLNEQEAYQQQQQHQQQQNSQPAGEQATAS